MQYPRGGEPRGGNRLMIIRNHECKNDNEKMYSSVDRENITDQGWKYDAEMLRQLKEYLTSRSELVMVTEGRNKLKTFAHEVDSCHTGLQDGK